MQSKVPRQVVMQQLLVVKELLKLEGVINNPEIVEDKKYEDANALITRLIKMGNLAILNILQEDKQESYFVFNPEHIVHKLFELFDAEMFKRIAVGNIHFDNFDFHKRAGFIYNILELINTYVDVLLVYTTHKFGSSNNKQTAIISSDETKDYSKHVKTIETSLKKLQFFNHKLRLDLTYKLDCISYALKSIEAGENAKFKEFCKSSIEFLKASYEIVKEKDVAGLVKGLFAGAIKIGGAVKNKKEVKLYFKILFIKTMLLQINNLNNEQPSELLKIIENFVELIGTEEFRKDNWHVIYTVQDALYRIASNRLIVNPNDTVATQIRKIVFTGYKDATSVDKQGNVTRAEHKQASINKDKPCLLYFAGVGLDSRSSVYGGVINKKNPLYRYRIVTATQQLSKDLGEEKTKQVSMIKIFSESKNEIISDYIKLMHTTIKAVDIKDKDIEVSKLLLEEVKQTDVPHFCGANLKVTHNVKNVLKEIKAEFLNKETDQEQIKNTLHDLQQDMLKEIQGMYKTCESHLKDALETANTKNNETKSVEQNKIIEHLNKIKIELEGNIKGKLDTELKLNLDSLNDFMDKVGEISSQVTGVLKELVTAKNEPIEALTEEVAKHTEYLVDIKKVQEEIKENQQESLKLQKDIKQDVKAIDKGLKQQTEILKQLTNNNSKLSQEIINFSKNTEALRDKLENKNEELHNSMQEVNSKGHAITKLEEELKELKTENIKAAHNKKQNEKLTNTIQDKEQQLKAQQDKLEQAEKQQAQLLKQQQELAKNNQATTDKLNTSIQELTASKQQLTSKEQELLSVTKKLTELQTAKLNKDQQVEKLKQQQTKQISDLNKQLQQQKDQVVKANKLMQEKSKQHKQNQKEISGLKGEVAQLQKTHNAKDKTLQTKIAELKQKEADALKAEQELKLYKETTDKELKEIKAAAKFADVFKSKFRRQLSLKDTQLQLTNLENALLRLSIGINAQANQIKEVKSEVTAHHAKIKQKNENKNDDVASKVAQLKRLQQSGSSYDIAGVLSDILESLRKGNVTKESNQ